jgi:hypothetical protein
LRLCGSPTSPASGSALMKRARRGL